MVLSHSMTSLRVVLVLAITVVGMRHAAAQRWTDATAKCTGTTAQWTNKVELADVDGDGLVDILVANGGDYSSPGTPEPSRVWKNLGTWNTDSACTEISAEALGGMTGLSRVIKAADVDGDGDLDLVTGGAYQSQLRMFARDTGTWIDTSAKLPQQATSIGDLEFGDVDGDGDLDMLLAEWGALDPETTGAAGRTRLYLNDGAGNFTDVTATAMPDVLVKWSWDVELVDVDNDWDLDALVSCKLCTSSLLFRNDGTGHFTDDADALPHFRNNYELEAMDIDGDGDLDLATLNDGGSLRDHILVNDGTGKFTDESATRLAGNANPSADDNQALWLDVDSDGDADLLVGSLGNDRLLINDGTGKLTLSASSTPNDTRSTLGIAVADLDGDGRLDVFQGQGEQAFAEKVQLATDMVAIDTAAPSVHAEMRPASRDLFTIVARVHDHQSPSRAHDWQRVWVEINGGEIDLKWYGEYLWRSPEVPLGTFRVCAKDRRGNQGCSDMPNPGADNAVAPPDGGSMPPIASPGCCDAGSRPTGSLALGLVTLGLVLRRRRRHRP